MIEFLIEIYSEEIPARFQEDARVQFATLFEKHSNLAGLSFAHLKTHVTPMRLVLSAHVSPSIPAQEVEKRGPRIGAPEQAIAGFCTGSGVSQDALIQKDGYYFAFIQTPEKSADILLPEIICAIIRDFSWGKTMRWPQATLPWVRPVRHIMTLLNRKPLSFEVKDFALITTGYTHGHRFLSPEKIQITSFDQCKDSLRKAHVIVDEGERKQAIVDALNKASSDLTLIPDEALLDEVTGLVEHAGVFIGKLDPSLLSVPEIVMTTSMRVHQKCFAFRGNDGKIAPYFAAVINTIPKDGGKALKQGYEMGMLKARLEDARFFYELDLKTPLLEHLPKLDKIIYHEKLGTLGDKIARHVSVSQSYAHQFNLKASVIEYAVKLAKCDLLTQMVGEFAELQGIMGEIYALAQGEDKDIAKSIADHYKPLGQNDGVPTNPLSIVSALIDKSDTLTGFIGVGILPTGSKDPFALRRCALGIIRIILENHVDMDLEWLIQKSVDSYKGKLSPNTVVEVLNFIRTRLGFALKDQGMRHDVVAACVGEEGASTLNLTHIAQRAQMLSEFISSEKGEELLSGYRRAFNILTAERKKDKKEGTYILDKHALKLPQETDLLHAVQNFSGDMMDLITLTPYINTFFNDLMVNDGNATVRRARLGLLEVLVSVFHRFADFHKLEG